MADINDRLRNDWSAPGKCNPPHDSAECERCHPHIDAPSRTTQHLIDMLVSRDAAGRAKYGTSLDRTDLSTDEWAQHMLEELLDAAGYLVRLREVLAARALR